MQRLFAPVLFIGRAMVVAVWVLLGLAAELALFPWLKRPARQTVVCLWSRGLLRVCGVRVQVQGVPLRTGAVLWVANHVSWIDIFVLNGVRTTAFIAKRSVRRWPVIGLLVARAGTLFIDRHQRYAVRAATQQMRACFARGDVVGLFPEGTTSEGLDVKPFHAGLLEPAVVECIPVQPVALRFFRGARRAPELSFVGEQTLVANLWFLLGAWGVRVECEFLEPVTPDSRTQRAALAHRLHERIRARVR